MIESTIQHIMAMTMASSGGNLSGFKMDAAYFFKEHPAFTTVLVNRTGDLSCLLDIRVTIANHVSTVQEVGHALAQVWQQLAYTHFQASACITYKEATILRFVTVISNERFYVTGKVTASSQHYPSMVEQFERMYWQVPFQDHVAG